MAAIRFYLNNKDILDWFGGTHKKVPIVEGQYRKLGAYSDGDLRCPWRSQVDLIAL